MSNFFDNLFGGGDDKKKAGGGVSPKNPFANMSLPGQQRKFQGTGQSLGGSTPGKLIHIELKNPGTLGLKVGFVAFWQTILLLCIEFDNVSPFGFI